MVRVVKRRDRYRIIEMDGKVAKNRYGSDADGGGHFNRDDACSQAKNINLVREHAKQQVSASQDRARNVRKLRKATAQATVHNVRALLAGEGEDAARPESGAA